MGKVTQEVKERVKEAVDVETLLSTLGFSLTRVAGNELRGKCPLHGGDNTTAFAYKTDIGRWRCYTHKCEMTPTGLSNDIVSIVKTVLNLSFVEAMQYLADFSGLNLDVLGGDSKEDTNKFVAKKEIDFFVKTTRRAYTNEEKVTIITEKQVDAYKYNRDSYFIDKGFKESTLNYFNVGTTVDSSGQVRATIPIRDIKGKLVGMSARAVKKGINPRYRISKGMTKDKVLYNLNNAISVKTDTIILVEGFKAAWAVYEAGYSNVTACMGAIVTPGQSNLLVTLSKMNCVIMFDGDKAGEEGMEKSYNRLKNIFSNVIEVFLPDNTGPDDLSREDLSGLLEINGVNK